MKIEFINHASVIIDCNGTRILTDPWYTGSVFNDGWNLIVENEKNINDLDFDYLWYSHEHPDHFNVSDLLVMDNARRKSVTILFQNTKDKKVRDFCLSKGFNFLELELGRQYKFGNAKLICDRVCGLDSWLSVSDGELTVLNLNDCRAEEESQIDDILSLVGCVDVLLTQYGSANWTGGKGSSLKEISKKKVFDRLDVQIQKIKPKYIVPFASFCWFSHEENYFCNLGSVSLFDFNERYFDQNIIDMYLGDVWEIGEDWNNLQRLLIWEDRIKGLSPIHKTKTINLNDLQVSFSCMIYYIREQNIWDEFCKLKIKPAIVHLFDYN